MKNKKPDVSAVILNYKNPAMTLKSVRAFLQSAKSARLSAQAVVVDNSAPETGGTLKKVLPEGAGLILNKTNAGFAKANNQGIKSCRAEIIILLNNDAWINSGCLKGGVKYLNEHPEAGIWAPRLLNQDKSIQISCAKFPTLFGLIQEYSLNRKLPSYPDLKKWKGPTEVDSVTGACLFLNKSTLKKAGMLDEDYFFQVEDIDYCRRVRKAGLKVIYDPRYSMVHEAGSSQNWRWFQDPYLHKNRILYFYKNHGFWCGFLASVIVHAGISLRKIIFLLTGVKSERA